MAAGGDEAIEALVLELKALLEQAPETVDGDVIGAWRERFDRSMLQAERGPAWPRLVTLAREVEQRIEAHVHLLEAEREVLRGMMAEQEQGARALKGYAPPMA